MFYAEHGGHCCGVSHIVGFSHTPPSSEQVQALQDTIDLAVEVLANHRVNEEEEPLYDGDFGHLLEVCLTDQQMTIWAGILKERGFKLQQRWLNDNSGNCVNLLTLVTKEPTSTPPYEW